MTKAFSVASWNVEHFKDDPARVDRVMSFLEQQKPDVFGLYEVEGATVFEAVTRRMPGYTFHITEGPQVQEILIGIAPGLTGFVTQRTEFNSGVSLLRPGALLTVTVDGDDYALLFLHTASGDEKSSRPVDDGACGRGVLPDWVGGVGHSLGVDVGDLRLAS